MTEHTTNKQDITTNKQDVSTSHLYLTAPLSKSQQKTFIADTEYLSEEIKQETNNIERINYFLEKEIESIKTTVDCLSQRILEGIKK